MPVFRMAAISHHVGIGGDMRRGSDEGIGMDSKGLRKRAHRLNYLLTGSGILLTVGVMTFCSVILFHSGNVFAEVPANAETSLTTPEAITPTQSSDESTQIYYLGSLVNAGKDNGYSESNTIDREDPHYGWTLGRFFVSGYTRVSENNSNPVFLKNLGDTVALKFTLEQDIDKLNGDDKLTISDDENGYDKYFGTKNDFGRGTLITRKTDYQNAKQKPIVYNNYLTGTAIGANTSVILFEEGDYEVALDYEIKKRKLSIAGKQLIGSYSNYRISFQFSVRNGNCMVFPYDVKTKTELANSSITENGFYLDLAKSRYLDIDIKREVLTEGVGGLSEDTRFNKPAKDGSEYTEDGIYTITVRNRYTEEETIKKIYVGANKILKAYVTTGLSIDEINKQLERGAHITEDGILVKASPNATTESLVAEESIDQTNATDSSSESRMNRYLIWIVGAVVAACIVLAISISAIRRRKSREEE
ncbi:MAG: hypothetical protein LBL54_01775 [Clostridiales Family XIII bacterium]|jgi:hypothetical protein|nr:hypothetical protein [Clostridiales Family XIII bacterium]